MTPADKLAQAAQAVIIECRNALAEELSAWDIDPPLHHVKQAHDKCEAWLAAYEAEPSEPEAATVCAQAYQVIGSMLEDLGQFETERASKILDNLSQARLVHEDVLPWPSFSIPSQQAKPRPLTDEQIRMLPIDVEFGWEQIVRVVERAHKIGAKTGGA